VQAGSNEGTRQINTLETDNCGRLVGVKQSSYTVGHRFFFDCQVHTDASDGQRSPAQLAREVYERNLTVVVTDHFTLDGATSAMGELDHLKATMGNGEAAKIIPGVEFSVKPEKSLYPRMRNMHVLGLGVDAHSKSLNRWVRRQRHRRRTCLEHAHSVRERMEGEKIRFNADFEKRLMIYGNVYKAIAKSIRSDENIKPIWRHLGVKVNIKRSRHMPKKTRQRLLEKQIIDSLTRVYGDPFVKRPSIYEAVEVINRAKGLASVAHLLASNPRLKHASTSRLGRFLGELRDFGFSGVESYHPAHDVVCADKLANVSREQELYVFAGSDAHELSDEIAYFIKE